MGIDRRFWLFWIAATGLLLLFAGSYGVVETSDARYAEIAREMYRSGDWIHPQLLQIHHYHKPPMAYWLAAAGYALFGVNPFGARFFLEISVSVQLLLAYLSALRLGLGRGGALLASIVYFSFPLVLASSRDLTTDSFLCTFALSAIYAWIRYRQEGKARWYFAYTLALALGFLTKGPVVFVAPVLFALFWRPAHSAPAASPALRALAWVLFVAVGGWWYLDLIAENGAFWDYFVKRQTVERFAKNVFHRHEPFWYYWVLTPLVGLPWLALLPWMARRIGLQRGTETLERTLALATFTGIFFFSLSSSKRIFYILPLFPLFAFWIASLLGRADGESLRRIERAVRLYAWGWIVLWLILPFVPIHGVRLPAASAILAGIGGLVLLGLGRMIGSLRLRAALEAALASAVLLEGASLAMAKAPQLFPIADPVAAWLHSHDLDTRTVVVYDRRLPSLSFALKRPIVSLYDGDRSLRRETGFEPDEGWRQNLYDLTRASEQQRLRARLKHEPSVLILYRKRVHERNRWLETLYPHRQRLGKWTIYY